MPCAVDDIRHMVGVDLIHLQKTFVPAFLSLSRVIKEGREGGVRSSYYPAGTAGHKIVADIKPLINLFENLRLVVFDPLVFPYRVFGAGGAGVIHAQVPQELVKTASRNLYDAAPHTFPVFLEALLIEIVHRASDGVSVFINKNRSLHLRAERHSLNRFGFDIRFP